jgi:DNA-binding IclR family transcriptional regulator
MTGVEQTHACRYATDAFPWDCWSVSEQGDQLERRSVFSRALTVLSAFAHAPDGERSLTDLARLSGLPLTTVHRLAGQLQREGVLERLPSGTYRIGLRLWELGMLAPRSHGLREVALPFLEDLYEVTHQNVQLIVLDGTEAVIVERLRSREAVKLISRAGGRLPVHSTSAGIALLAHADPDAVDAVLARPLSRYTDATIRSEHELRSAIARVRQQGFIELREHLTVGAVSIAAPILVRPGAAVGAISVVTAVGTDTGPLVPAIMTTARAIGRALSGARSSNSSESREA